MPGFPVSNMSHRAGIKDTNIGAATAGNTKSSFSKSAG
jgi:hypothetical protein